MKLLHITQRTFLAGCLGLLANWAQAQTTTVFQEKAGLVAVEAEHFSQQTSNDIRAFQLTTSQQQPTITPDGDPPHVAGASGGAYLEVLPDTRRTHSDKLIKGTNFSPEPGKMAVLRYQVHFATPGRYYVWVRAYSTGTEDNGLHVGLDGQWPESGQRMQWCEGKNTWRWESKQRTEAEHCGEPHKIYLDIASAGEHTIHFSMREDGFEFDKWLMTTDREFERPTGVGPEFAVHAGDAPQTYPYVEASAAPAENATTAQPQNTRGNLIAQRQDTASRNVAPLESPTQAVSALPLVQPRQPNGTGKVDISGELKKWHKVTLTLDGPFAHEQDNAPNPFTDLRMNVEFKHADGTTYLVPAYFAADGEAANSSANSGTKWRAHLAPDKTGQWSYKIGFEQGALAALDAVAEANKLAPYDGQSGTFNIAASDKSGRDLRSQGRLEYVGQHYLRFADSQQYFLKAGADAPETLLGYADFDGTVAGKPDKVPLKSWGPHVKDWQAGDPTWQAGKGKGLIGAVNYLSGKGCNAFSFLTYNAGGDGDNVWPFIDRNDKLHYDCSKLDQWGIVFDHGTSKGMYLHFKLQETENDDHRRHRQEGGSVPESLDGGDLGTQRKLYCRELIARYAHNLALNWNLGEENTQSTAQHLAMLNYIEQLDPYGHNRVVHTFPNEQDLRYAPLLGDQSNLTGLSLQNSHIKDTHWQVVKWVKESDKAGKPWVVAFDESGTAAHGQCPDIGYKGFDGHDRSGEMIYTEHEVRQQTLWGTLMGGGAGCEYYFGYQFVENDLLCEDWRSRDRSWDYCRIAINFFHEQQLPFWEMKNYDELLGNPQHDNTKYCFAKAGQVYVVYLPQGGSSPLDLSSASGDFSVKWFNPRTGGTLANGSVTKVSGGKSVSVGEPPQDAGQDWVVVLRK